MNVLELSEQEIIRRNSMNELRAMGIEPIENPDLTKYADAAQVVSNNLLSQLVSVE